MTSEVLSSLAETTSNSATASPATSRKMQVSRLCWVWLLLSIVLGCFSSGHWVVPVLVWIGPPLVMRFMAAQPNWLGNLCVIISGYIVFWVTQRGIIPMATEEFAIAGCIAALIGFLPYWIYRRVSERSDSFWITFTFPAMIVFIEYLLVQGPFGSWGSMATTQYRNTALIQLLSVGGTSSLVFLICWVGAVIDWAWKHSFDWGKTRTYIIATVVLLASVLGMGWWRQSLPLDPERVVRVGGVVAEDKAFQQDSIIALVRAVRMGASMTDSQRNAYIEDFNKRAERFFLRSQNAAQDGAQIVYWSEAALVMLKEDEPALLKRAATFAEKQQVYLGLAYACILSQKKGPFLENKLVLFSPKGLIINEYQKNLIPPGEPSVPGTVGPALLETDLGAISQVICFDTDFPSLMRKPGAAGAGIVFAPSNDWKDAAEPHLSVAALRSVENGYSLVRITSSGISAVVDPRGKVLFEKNSYDERLCDFVVDVPLGNGRSFYSWFGDSIAILSGVASCLVVVMAFLPVGKAKPTPACSANDNNEAHRYQTQP